MVVQVPTVRTLLDIAVLGEVLHPDAHVYHRLPAVLTVQAGLGGKHRRMSHDALLSQSKVKVTQTATRHCYVREMDQEFSEASLLLPKAGYAKPKIYIQILITSPTH